ncbi:rhomboid family intramembrane serine protease [Nesterenkonia pannonica]|uniref:rhomboid family intramembrane serine protease n=1 Tax=Nesterenkonia pannonica TaxID=1548602 RepID=UPI002164C0C3|nr:rhomboid family intramembrane serine protease [Nesterenkonia pannonica]
MSLHLQPGDDHHEPQRSLGTELKHSMVRTFLPVLLPLAVMWLLWLVNMWTGNWLNLTLRLTPRSLEGLSGILFMPVLHGSFGHLLGNTFSWLVLGGMVSLLTRRFTFVMSGIWLVSGIVLWLIGTPWVLRPDGSSWGGHVGASGVIYGFISFLIIYGLITRRVMAMVFAIFVIVFYGLSMLVGMMPVAAGMRVSWTGHLAGAVANVAVAWIFTRGVREERRSRPSRTPAASDEAPPWF